jgi:zinc transport system substrate-binding protein
MKPTVLVLITKCIAIVGILLIASGCVVNDEDKEKITVAVTIAPQRGFVNAIGGDKVDIVLMVPPGAEPHTYEPSPSQMLALEKADIYAKVGSEIEFEIMWFDKLVSINPNMKIIDCSRGVILKESTEMDDHSEILDLEETRLDPHIWLSPLNAIEMVRNITEGLVEVDPGNSDYYMNNRDFYINSLQRLDSEIRDSFEGIEKRLFLVYHSAWGYFASTYNLEMITVEKEGKELTPAGLASVIDQINEHSISVIFVSPQFNTQSANTIAQETNCTVAFIDPLAEDYITNLQYVINKFKESMISNVR